MFGETLRACRGRAGLTQEELADKAGVSVRNVRNLEAGRIGRPRPGTVQLLADALGLHGTERERFCTAALAGASEPPATDDRTLWPVPAQLPIAVSGFAGRSDELRALRELLDDPAQPSIVVITGTAGVGKTTLAVHWCRQIASRFPDGALYINLRGFAPNGPAMDPMEAVRGFLDALGAPPGRIPGNPDAQAALYRSLLSDKRILIILDNALDSAQVRPLLPGTPGCLTVVTSRDVLAGLVAIEGARHVTLDLLSCDEARRMLAHRLSDHRIAAEPDATTRIIARCSRLPLALAVVAARAAIQPRLSLTALANQLRGPGADLDALTSVDVSADLRGVLSWSYRALGDDAARMFRLLGTHPGPDISLPAAASLTAAPMARARALLSELAQANLITEHSPGRFGFHDLLRAYAAELARLHNSESERQAASRRALDHYLHTAHTAADRLNPYRQAVAPPPAAHGAVPEEIADHGQAMAWFSRERRVLLSAVRHAAEAGRHAHAWQLALNLSNFFNRQGHWQEWRDALETALAAAQAGPDTRAQALVHHNLGRACTWLRRVDEAHGHYLRALELYGRLGDRNAQARTHLNLESVLDQQGRPADALSHAQQALDLFRAVGYRHGEAQALNDVGWYHIQLGLQEQALGYCQEALTLLRELGDRGREACTLDSLGYAHHQLGRHERAVTCFRQARDLFAEVGDRGGEASALTHLGDAQQAMGDRDAARQAWSRALRILDDLGDSAADRLRAKLRAGG